MNTPAVHARFAIEIYRHFGKVLPDRIRVPLKHYIDANKEEWKNIGTLKTLLKKTPYKVMLDIQHWHQRWTYIKGEYPEPHVTNILDQYLLPGHVFIDIGANIGIHTLYAAHKVQPQGQCIAIEPNPHSYSRLNDHVINNQLMSIVDTFQLALSDEVGTVILHGCEDENVGSTVVKNGQNQSCEVPMDMADNVLPTLSESRHGICKVDVEGHEMHVLLGMREFINRHPNIAYIVEVTDEWLQIADSSAASLFDFFRAYDYTPHLISPSQRQPTRLHKPADIPQYDVLFTKQQLE